MSLAFKMTARGSIESPMTARGDQAYRQTGLVPAERRGLRYDPTRPIDDRAFAAARRHSRQVSWLKVVLPALAIVAAGIFWSATHFVPTDLAAIARGAGIDVTSESVTMNHPRISGFEGTRRAYEVQAESAVQSLSDPKIVTFHQIDASIGLDAAGTARLNAVTGVYDGNYNTLFLKDGIAITTDTGYSAAVGEAAIDLGKGSLVSSMPIEISTAQGTIRANGVNVTDRGKRVVFSNGVSITFLPSGDLAAPSKGP
jgi:lipopolysaccharide export system protein LptC